MSVPSASIRWRWSTDTLVVHLAGLFGSWVQCVTGRVQDFFLCVCCCLCLLLHSLTFIVQFKVKWPRLRVDCCSIRQKSDCFCIRHTYIYLFLISFLICFCWPGGGAVPGHWVNSTSDFMIFPFLQEAIIGGLQSETTYSVAVAAYTTKGDGARTKAKVITTTGAGQLFYSLDRKTHYVACLCLF